MDMLVKMRENKGFTLVELMIVVAIIGILAAVAVPFYQKYIQKSRIAALVMPGVHSIETNIATYYSMKNAFPDSSDTIDNYAKDADTTYFIPYLGGSTDGSVNFMLKNTDNKFSGELLTDVLTVTPDTTDGKITRWKMTGTLAQELGLENE